jgi:hypothetical protein
MVGDPLKERVGEDEIGGTAPMGGVAREEPRPRQTLPRRREHRLRRIDADEIGVGPTFGERLRRKAGAATEVDDAARRARRNARQQVDGRAITFGLEAAVDLRAPTVH